MKKLKRYQWSLSSLMNYVILVSVLCFVCRLFMGQSYQETYQLKNLYFKKDVSGSVSYCLLETTNFHNIEINGKKISIKDRFPNKDSKLKSIKIIKDISGDARQWVILKYRKNIIPELRYYDVEVHANLD